MPREARPKAAPKPHEVLPMRRILLELTTAVSLTLAAIIATAGGVSASDVMVMNAFARASATPVAKSLPPMSQS